MGYTYQDYAQAYKDGTAVYKPKPFAPPSNPSDFYAKPNPGNGFYAKPNPISQPLAVPKPVGQPLAVPSPKIPGSSFGLKLPGAGVLGGVVGSILGDLIFPDPVADGTLPKPNNPLKPVSPPVGNPLDGTGLGQQVCVDYVVTIGYVNFPSAPTDHNAKGGISLQFDTLPDGRGAYNLVSSCPGYAPVGILGGLEVGPDRLYQAYILNIQTADGSPDVGGTPTETPDKYPPGFPVGYSLTSPEIIPELVPSSQPGGKLGQPSKKPETSTNNKNKPDLPVFVPNQVSSGTINEPSYIDKIKTEKGGAIDKYKPGGILGEGQTGGEIDKYTPGGVLDKGQTGGGIDSYKPDNKISIKPDGITPDIGGTTPPNIPPKTPPNTQGGTIKTIKDILDKLLEDGIGGMNCEELKECLNSGDGSNNPLLGSVSLPYTICTENPQTKEHTAEILMKQFLTPIGSFSPDDILKFVKSANLAEEGCEDNLALAMVPEWWQVRIGSDRPQAVVMLRELKSNGKFGSGVWSMTIPHYDKPRSFKPSIPDFNKGDCELIATLKDNSKFILNAKDKASCLAVWGYVKTLINPEMLTGKPPKTGDREGEYKKVKVKSTRLQFFSQGQKNFNPLNDFVIRL